MPDPSACLLLVEDDAVIAGCLRRKLEIHGYEIVCAARGSEAILLLEARAAELWCVITDVGCGDAVSGWMIGRRARTLNAQVNVVYMTGESAVQWATEGVAGSILLQKPFASDALIAALAQLSDG